MPFKSMTYKKETAVLSPRLNRGILNKSLKNKGKISGLI